MSFTTAGVVPSEWFQGKGSTDVLKKMDLTVISTDLTRSSFCILLSCGPWLGPAGGFLCFGRALLFDMDFHCSAPPECIGRRASWSLRTEKPASTAPN